jgi:hypothetical protein
MSQDKLQKYRERYQDFSDHFSEERKRMLEDLRFSNPADPQQWEQVVRNARETAGRPTLTFDHTNQYINQVVNDARQNKPGIQCLPVDSGADVQTAEVYEGMIRQIEYASRAGIAYDTSIEHAARCGKGWLRVVTEVINPALNEQQLLIKAVHDPLSVSISPESVEPNGSDATDGFVETTMSVAAFEKKYGKRKSQTSWDNRGNGWETDKTIRICEYYKLRTVKTNNLDVQLPNGDTLTLDEDAYWKFAQSEGYQPFVQAQYMSERRSFDWCLMTGSDILEETEVLSEWLPLVPVYGNVLWIDGKRYVCGLTRQLMDGQRAKNYERSAQIEMIALQPKSPFILPFESVENFESEWGAANTSNKAYLPYNALDDQGRPLPAPQRMAPPQIPSAFIQSAQMASDDMQAAIGMYKSNLGAPSNATSGRAKMQDQREGDTATYHYVDNQGRAIEQVARILVNMIPKYIDTKRAARILGVDGKAKTVMIDPQGASKPQAKTPTFNLSHGTYDVRVKTGPAYATMRQEASEALTAIVGKSPELMSVLGPSWARMQDWPDADKIAKLLMSLAPPQVQAIENEDMSIPPEAQGIVASLKSQLEQMKQQLQQVTQAADTQQAKIFQDHETNEINRQKNDIAMYEAETKRIAALKPPDPGMTPDQVQLLVMQLMQQSAQPAPMYQESPESEQMQTQAGQPDMMQQQMEQQESQNMPLDDGMQQEQMQEPTLPGMGNEPNFS